MTDQCRYCGRPENTPVDKHFDSSASCYGPEHCQRFLAERVASLQAGIKSGARAMEELSCERDILEAKVASLTRERDEAREATLVRQHSCGHWVSGHVSSMSCGVCSQINSLTRERDEARLRVLEHQSTLRMESQHIEELTRERDAAIKRATEVAKLEGEANGCAERRGTLLERILAIGGVCLRNHCGSYGREVVRETEEEIRQ